MLRTNNHAGELEALSDALPVDLVGKVGEADVTHELFPDDAGQMVRAAVGGGACVAVGRRSTVAVCTTVWSVRLGRRRRRDTGTGHCEKEKRAFFTTRFALSRRGLEMKTRQLQNGGRSVRSRGTRSRGKMKKVGRVLTCEEGSGRGEEQWEVVEGTEGEKVKGENR